MHLQYYIVYGQNISLAIQTQPTPARIAFSIMHRFQYHVRTESDLRCGWLGLNCETRKICYTLLKSKQFTTTYVFLLIFS